MKKKEQRYELPLLLAGIIWGSSFVSGKIGVEHVDPVLFSFLRYVMASLSVLVVLLFYKNFDRSLFRDRTIWAISGFNAVAMVLQNIGMTMTTATNSVLLININIVFIAILAIFILGDRMTKQVGLGLMVGLIGVFVISTNGDISSIGGGSFLGNLFVFTAGILWAFYVVFYSKLLNAGKDLLSSTMTIIMITTLILLPISLAMSPDTHIDGSGWMALVYTGVVCTTVAFVLYAIGLKGLGATTTSVILLVEIVFGMFFAFMVLREIPTISTAIGGAFILLAVVVISIARNGNGKKRKNEEIPVQE
ncbi:MAG TPA: DMT family transporter [Methanomassiliicoccales archaeon]|nr:DMT family transporter [Methanomassiliicoccales archaeon]